MELPKFLIADNSELEEALFVIHTEYPRFILNVYNQNCWWRHLAKLRLECVLNRLPNIINKNHLQQVIYLLQVRSLNFFQCINQAN